MKKKIENRLLKKLVLLQKVANNSLVQNANFLFLGDYIVSVNMQRLFEDLLYKYRVDLAFWAHYHAYERTCKLYKGKCTEDGILHLIVGTAGKDVDADVWYDKDWSIFRSNDYGYGRVTVSNYSAMLFEWIQNRSKKVVDSVWLLK